MLTELMNDNKLVIKRMRAAHEIADKHDDVATASVLENFIDAAEKRNWFLFEASADGLVRRSLELGAKDRPCRTSAGPCSRLASH